MKAWQTIVALLSPATILVMVGLPLLIAGLAMVWAPLAFLVPGAALVALGLWLALPLATRL